MSYPAKSLCKYRFQRALTTFFLVVILPVASYADSPRLADLNGGYYLLHHLCEDEEQLPILLDLKHAPDDVNAFAVSVSKTAKRSLSSLEKLRREDTTVRFDQNPLPKIERDVRESIQDDKQHQLLFGTSNGEFVRRLLESQIEASTYAQHLSKVLAEQDPKRRKSLERISEDWQTLREQAYRLLRDSGRP